MNRADLIGYLGQDPTLRFASTGKAVANFSVATTERFTIAGTKREETTWHRIVAWEKLAETASKFLKKGRLVRVEGKIRYGEYTNKEGVKIPTTEIVAQRIEFLDRGEKASTAKTEVVETQGENVPEGPASDEVPDAEQPVEERF